MFPNFQIMVALRRLGNFERNLRFLTNHRVVFMTYPNIYDGAIGENYTIIDVR